MEYSYRSCFSLTGDLTIKERKKKPTANKMESRSFSFEMLNNKFQINKINAMMISFIEHSFYTLCWISVYCNYFFPSTFLYFQLNSICSVTFCEWKPPLKYSFISFLFHTYNVRFISPISCVEDGSRTNSKWKLYFWLDTHHTIIFFAATISRKIFWLNKKLIKS